MKPIKFNSNPICRGCYHIAFPTGEETKTKWFCMIDSYPNKEGCKKKINTKIYNKIIDKWKKSKGKKFLNDYLKDEKLINDLQNKISSDG